MARWILVLAITAGCSASPRQVCERAVARFDQCMRDTVWWVIPQPDREPSSAAHAEVIATCSADRPRVARYRTCLAEPDCAAFLDCTKPAAGLAVGWGR